MNIWCVLMLITNPRVSNCALVCVHFCLVVQPSLHLEDDDALFGHNMAEAACNAIVFEYSQSQVNSRPAKACSSSEGYCSSEGGVLQKPFVGSLDFMKRSDVDNERLAR